MNQESNQNYSIAYNKDETYLKRAYASLKGELRPIWINLFAFIILIGLDVILNSWLGWREFLLRSIVGACLLGISLFLRPKFPQHLLKEELQAKNYADILHVMKGYYRITFPKMIKFILFYSILFVAVAVLLRSEENYTLTDLLTFKWVSESRSNLIFFVGLFIFTLYTFQSTYSRLNKIEHI